MAETPQSAKARGSLSVRWLNDFGGGVNALTLRTIIPEMQDADQMIRVRKRKRRRKRNTPCVESDAFGQSRCDICEQDFSKPPLLNLYHGWDSN